MRLFWLALGFSFALLGLIMTAQAAHAVEEPQWRLVYEDGPFAIRDYAPTIVAETRIGGERGAAINQGFRRLARYIFGAPSRNRHDSAGCAKARGRTHRHDSAGRAGAV